MQEFFQDSSSLCGLYFNWHLLIFQCKRKPKFDKNRDGVMLKQKKIIVNFR